MSVSDNIVDMCETNKKKARGVVGVADVDAMGALDYFGHLLKAARSPRIDRDYHILYTSSPRLESEV